jgi:predicted esterase
VEPAVLAARLGARPIELVAGDRDSYVPAGSIEATAQALRGFGAGARASRFSGAHLIAPLPLLRAAGRAAPSVTS